jgi:hypothetical protein
MEIMVMHNQPMARGALKYFYPSFNLSASTNVLKLINMFLMEDMRH